MTVDERKLVAATSSPSTVYGHIDTSTSNRRGRYVIAASLLGRLTRAPASEFHVIDVEPVGLTQHATITSPALDYGESIASAIPYRQTILNAIYSHLSQAVYASTTLEELRVLLGTIDEETPTRPEPDPQRVAPKWLESLSGISSNEPATSLATWYEAITGEEEG